MIQTTNKTEREVGVTGRSTSTVQNIGWLATLTRHIPPGQFGRYLVVGAFNTIFGYSTFALLTALLTPHGRHAYILAGAVSNVMNITVAFLNYKWFIFKTKGNYLREWLRCLLVYSGGIALGTILLPITVFIIRYITHADSSAPYIAGALLLAVNVVLSFLGHKRFSFPSSQDSSAPAS